MWQRLNWTALVVVMGGWLNVSAQTAYNRNPSETLTTSASLTALKNTASPRESLCTGDGLAVTTLPPNLVEKRLIGLQWSATGALWHSVYRATATGGPYVRIATCLPTASYVDRAITSGTTYYYVVTSTFSSAQGPQESQYSNQSAATAPTADVLSIRKTVSRPIVVTLTTSASLTVQTTGRTVLLSQTLTTSAAVTGVPNPVHVATPSETLTTSATVAVSKTFTRSLAETVVTTSSLSRSQVLTRAVTQSSSTSDSVSGRIGFARAISQSLTTSASVGRSQTLNRSRSETFPSVASLSVTGPQTGGPNFNVTLAEGISTGDSLVVTSTHSVSLAVTLSTSASVDRSQVLSRSITQALITTDVGLKTTKTLTVSFTEALNTVASVVKGNTFLRMLVQQLSTADFAAAGVNPHRVTNWNGRSLISSGGPIPSTLFGLHFRFNQNVGATATLLNWPSVPFGSLRLWDTDTRWQNLEPSQGTFDWTALDSYLASAKLNGVDDALLTLSATPQWAATNPSASPCDFDSAPYSSGVASCSPPSDVASNGTGSNQFWRDFIYNLGLHLRGLDPTNYANVSTFEIWNEFSRSTSWLGTNAQLIRLSQDANCILTGRGVAITATGGLCSASGMNEPAIALLPRALVSSPSALASGADIAALGTYLGLTGANQVDAVAVHAYAYAGLGSTYPEGIAIDWAAVNGQMPVAAFALPTWSTEGSWGVTASNLTDPDLQEAYVARYFLVGWSIGFDRLYWYATNSTRGTLINQTGSNGCNDGGTNAGCPTKAATGWASVYSWMVGNQMTQGCSTLDPNTVLGAMASLSTSAAVTEPWTCAMRKADGTKLLAVWDPTKTCAAGVCTTSAYSYSPQYKRYYTLDAPTVPVLLAGPTVAIGAKPILLSQ